MIRLILGFVTLRSACTTSISIIQTHVLRFRWTQPSEALRSLNFSAGWFICPSPLSFSSSRCFPPPCGSYSALVAVSQGFLESWMSCLRRPPRMYSPDGAPEEGKKAKRFSRAVYWEMWRWWGARCKGAAFELSGRIGSNCDWYSTGGLICFTALSGSVKRYSECANSKRRQGSRRMWGSVRVIYCNSHRGLENEAKKKGWLRSDCDMLIGLHCIDISIEIYSTIILDPIT